MKTLLTIRHAKTEVGFGLKDFDRSLNERGLRDAPALAKRVASQNIPIDVLISSPAKRAKQTAELFCKPLQHTKEEIIFIDKLYHAPAAVYYEVIEDINDKFSSAAIFGHNPGITDFVNTLVKEISTDNMPTCGVFAVKADVKSWKEFLAAEKEFLFFDYPKNI